MIYNPQKRGGPRSKQKDYVYCLHCCANPSIPKNMCKRQKKGLKKHTEKKHHGLSEYWGWEYCNFVEVVQVQAPAVNIDAEPVQVE